MTTSPYTLLLTLHDDLRWLVLLSALVAVVVSIRGISGKRPFRPLGRVAGLVYVSLLDTQVLLGILLCFLSPWVAQFWASPFTAMKVKEARFFAIEHGVLMLVALALAHIGAVRSRRAAGDPAAYRNALLWYSLSVPVLLAGIPWWRPAFRI